MGVALKLHQGNQLNAAQAIYEEIIRAKHLDAELMNLYGTLLYQKKLNDVAIKFLKKAILLCPQKALFYNRLGAGLQATQENQKAVLIYSRATVLDNDLFEAHLNLANLLLKLDNIKAALYAARRAVFLNSSSWVARLRLGAILQSMNKFDLAISELNLASMQNPLELEPYFSLCQIHLKLKNNRDGLK
jgi:tetratricopeptide (TPR) repeat protein